MMIQYITTNYIMTDYIMTDDIMTEYITTDSIWLITATSLQLITFYMIGSGA